MTATTQRARPVPSQRRLAAARAVALLKRWPHVLAFGILAVALGAQALLKTESEWNDVYVQAASRLWHGQDIYGPGSAYLYPPFMALVALPFTLMPPLVSRALWFAINMTCLAGVIRTAWRLAGGTPLADIARWDRPEWIAATLGLACGASSFLNALAHQQADIVIAALLIWGCGRLAAGSQGSAGLLIGVAAACKATPLLWCPYLVWRRKWIAAALVGVVAVVINLLPNLVAAPPDGGTWLMRWLTRFVLPAQQLNMPLGTWGSDVMYNQSLAGTVQRLANTALEFRGAVLDAVGRPAIDNLTLKLICYALLAGMIAVSVAAAKRASANDAPAAARRPDGLMFEFSLVLTLMLLMSPMSSPAHFGLLILPGYALARFAVTTRDRAVFATVLAAAALSVLTNKDPVGETAYTVLLWSGAITAATLLLWLGCVMALWGRRFLAAG